MRANTADPSPQVPDPITDALAERIAARLMPQLAELLERGDGAQHADGLIDSAECGRRVGVSLPTLRRANLPHVMVGDHRRYHWPAVLAELQRRAQLERDADGGQGDGGVQ